MDNLNSITRIVKTILQTYPDTRNSDNLLYYHVLKVVGDKNKVDIETMSIPTFLLKMKDYGLPPFESVRRARQKIQASYPELSAKSDVEAYRQLNEQEYRDYARKVDV